MIPFQLLYWKLLLCFILSQCANSVVLCVSAGSKVAPLCSTHTLGGSWEDPSSPSKQGNLDWPQIAPGAGWGDPLFAWFAFVMLSGRLSGQRWNQNDDMNLFYNLIEIYTSIQICLYKCEWIQHISIYSHSVFAQKSSIFGKYKWMMSDAVCSVAVLFKPLTTFRQIWTT